MVRIWWFCIDWLIDVYSWSVDIASWLRDNIFVTCADILLFLLYGMSIFKKIVSWPWRKIITVVVKVGTWLLDKLPADSPKLPKP